MLRLRFLGHNPSGGKKDGCIYAAKLGHCSETLDVCRLCLICTYIDSVLKDCVALARLLSPKVFMISRFISVQETLQMLKCLCVIEIRVLGAGGRWGDTSCCERYGLSMIMCLTTQ